MEHERCILCHRKLKDHESRIRGLGPNCWRKLKKLDREEKAKRKAKMRLKKARQDMLKGQITMFDEEGEIHAR